MNKSSALISTSIKPKLVEEIYCIPLENGRYLIYAPLKQVAFIANNKMVNFIADLKSGHCDPELDSQGNLIEFLKRLQLIDVGPEHYPITEFYGFPEPTGVSLFLTTACNLRCTYCYANAGETPTKYMQTQTALNGIDFVIQNAVKRGVDTIELSYHGGGEPTVNWKTLTESLAYAKLQADKYHLNVIASLATNGVFNKEHCQWIVKNLNGVSLSFDGLPEIHDKNRLTIKGKGSSTQVLQTLQQFDKAGFSYGIRMTVTADQIQSMPDAVNYIFQNFNPTRLQIEPAYQMGRWAQAPSAETQAFIDAFREAEQQAHAYQRTIEYSAARLGVLTNHFCGVTQDSFCLSTEGKVSSCYEAFDEDTPNAEIFFYGTHDADNGYQFDLSTLNQLRQQAVQHKDFCQGCFAKWSCAGDCYNKALQVNGNNDFKGSDRCHITRELTKDQICSAIALSGGLVWQGESDNSDATFQEEVHHG